MRTHQQLAKLKETLSKIHVDLMMKEQENRDLLLFPQEMREFQIRNQARKEYYLKIVNELK